jgi:hypothetical protein
MPEVVRLVLAVALAVAAAGLVLAALTTYRRLAALHRQIDRADANLQVAIERRAVALSRLTEALANCPALDSDIVAEVARQPTDANVRHLLGALHGLPEQQADPELRAAFDEVERQEAMIADRRRLLAEVRRTFTARITHGWGRLLARLFRWPA